MKGRETTEPLITEILGEAFNLKENALKQLEQGEIKSAFIFIKQAINKLKKISNYNQVYVFINEVENCFKLALEITAQVYEINQVKKYRTLASLYFDLAHTIYNNLDPNKEIDAYTEAINYLEQIPNSELTDIDKRTFFAAYWNLHSEYDGTSAQTEALNKAILWLGNLEKPQEKDKRELALCHLRLCKLMGYSATPVVVCQKILEDQPKIDYRQKDYEEALASFRAGLYEKLISADKLQKYINDLETAVSALTAENSDLKKSHDLLTHKKQKKVSFAKSVHSSFKSCSEKSASNEARQSITDTDKPLNRRTTLTNNTK